MARQRPKELRDHSFVSAGHIILTRIQPAGNRDLIHPSPRVLSVPSPPPPLSTAQSFMPFKTYPKIKLQALGAATVVTCGNLHELVLCFLLKTNGALNQLITSSSSCTCTSHDSSFSMVVYLAQRNSFQG